MRTRRWKGGILIWGMVGMALKDVSEVVSLIKSKYMTEVERELNIISLLGGDRVLLVSPSYRNVITIQFTNIVGGEIEFKVSWGLFHKNVWEIFNEEKDYIKLAISGPVIPEMFEKTCFLRYVGNTISGISLKGYFKWGLNVDSLMFMFRRWLERFDVVLSSFEHMLTRFDIRLGNHKGCRAGLLEYSDAIVYYKLFLDDSLSPEGEIMVKRDKVSVGVGFFEGFFDWTMWYQVRGQLNPLEDYIRSMLVNGDV
jgi:hypothetical protein